MAMNEPARQSIAIFFVTAKFLISSILAANTSTDANHFLS
jgi:hypothetical protein